MVPDETKIKEMEALRPLGERVIDIGHTPMGALHISNLVSLEQAAKTYFATLKQHYPLLNKVAAGAQNPQILLEYLYPWFALPKELLDQQEKCGHQYTKVDILNALYKEARTFSDNAEFPNGSPELQMKSKKTSVWLRPLSELLCKKKKKYSRAPVEPITPKQNRTVMYGNLVKALQKLVNWDPVLREITADSYASLFATEKVEELGLVPYQKPDLGELMRQIVPAQLKAAYGGHQPRLRDDVSLSDNLAGYLILSTTAHSLLEFLKVAAPEEIPFEEYKLKLIDLIFPNQTDTCTVVMEDVTFTNGKREIRLSRPALLKVFEDIQDELSAEIKAHNLGKRLALNEARSIDLLIADTSDLRALPPPASPYEIACQYLTSDLTIPLEKANRFLENLEKYGTKKGLASNVLEEIYASVNSLISWAGEKASAEKSFGYRSVLTELGISLKKTLDYEVTDWLKVLLIDQLNNKIYPLLKSKFSDPTKINTPEKKKQYAGLSRIDTGYQMLIKGFMVPIKGE